MKQIVFTLLTLMLAMQLSGQEKSVPLNEIDSLAYAIGVTMYQGVAQLDAEIDINMVAAGLKAAADQDAFFTVEKSQEIIQAILSAMSDEKAEANMLAGKKFLENNSNEEGVVVTESGLQYIVIKQGTGQVPVSSDKVKVHYTGTLLDGTTFDSSIERGEPVEFGVNQVIEGWKEILQIMPVGSYYKVFVASEMAYGNRSVGQLIKPNSVLIFDIELLGIVEK